MNEWTTKTLHRGSCTIIVRRPVLTRTEQAKREQAAQETLGRVLCEYLDRKETSEK